jgi:hypothetical protein
MPLMAGELTRNAEPLSSTPARCPKCGCCKGLIPVCQSYYTTKKETKYHYCCRCEPICILDHGPCCSNCVARCCNDRHGDGPDCGTTVNGCASGKCNCLIKTQYKLVKIPYTVETPACKCRIEWVCPHCGCNCSHAVETESTQAPDDVPPSSPAAKVKPDSGNEVNPATCGFVSVTDKDVELSFPK